MLGLRQHKYWARSEKGKYITLSHNNSFITNYLAQNETAV